MNSRPVPLAESRRSSAHDPVTTDGIRSSTARQIGRNELSLVLNVAGKSPTTLKPEGRAATAPTNASSALAIERRIDAVYRRQSNPPGTANGAATHSRHLVAIRSSARRRAEAKPRRSVGVAVSRPGRASASSSSASAWSAVPDLWHRRTMPSGAPAFAASERTGVTKAAAVNPVRVLRYTLTAKSSNVIDGCAISAARRSTPTPPGEAQAAQPSTTSSRCRSVGSTRQRTSRRRIGSATATKASAP